MPWQDEIYLFVNTNLKLTPLVIKTPL